ncbi:hypothetical protein PsorP6_008047 [Peronosclerospora sorghi]|uniref:Uncharacterized protein n=1 Tax=Peronosclerospora sorghi TaxID=230839 RepID=A0ACC0WBK1_9STRA|nr:hypothetical protein PsorP6_008047 [Peronosclerospora sorghi]
MSEQSIRSQRLQRVYETTKHSLNTVLGFLFRASTIAQIRMMEMERIDEEFGTAIFRSRGRRKEHATTPVRCNPRRSTRHKY